MNSFAETNCKDLQANIFNQGNKLINDSFIQEVERNANGGSLCSKNIMGRMFASGIGVAKNWERSYSIFTDLSNSGYPPAQLNLAILVSEREDYDLKTLISFLVGLIYTQSSSVEFAYIAKSAKDLGVYLINEKLNNEKISSTDKEFFKNLLNEFQLNIADASISAAGNLINREVVGKSNEVAIVEMISMGASSFNRRSNISNARPSAVVRSNIANSIQPSLYYITPISGNMLYVMPLR